MGLVIVFLFVLAIRLTFAFQTPFFSSSDSYLQLRAIESLQHGHLLVHDPLGHDERTLFLSSLFNSILAFFAILFPPDIILKVIPNIFGSLLVIPAYFIAYTLSQHSRASLLASLLAGITPAFFSSTFNHLTPLTLAVPVFFALLALWMRIPQTLPLYLVCLFALAFLHPLAIVFVLGLSIYLIVLFADQTTPTKATLELSLFSVVFVLWSQFVLYKELLLFHGPAVVWQNIPQALLDLRFADTTILGALWHIGIITLIAGTYVIYKKTHERSIQLLLSVGLLTVTLLWLKLITLPLGFMILGILFAILFAPAWVLLSDYFTHTKFASFRPLALGLFFLLALAGIATPSFLAVQEHLAHTITREEVRVLQSLDETLPDTARLITPAPYGHYAAALAKRPVVIDEYYFLQPQINERYQDVQRLYTTSFQTEAVGLFDKYNATHLIVPLGAKDIAYRDAPCFERIHATNIRVYAKDPECKLRVVS